MSIAIAEYPTLTDEKLDEYLGIWKRHIEQNRKERLDFTITISLRFDYPFTLTFGEEKRQLTWAQAQRFYDTFTPLYEKYGKQS
jgi:hypothetical protein